jgi:hypothetical protein
MLILELYDKNKLDAIKVSPIQAIRQLRAKTRANALRAKLDRRDITKILE